MLMFAFMQRALICGALLSITIASIGVFMVNRKTSMLGEAMSHVSLSGVAVGLILGCNPVIGAIIACAIAGLSIEKVRKHFPLQGDMATAIITSLGLGFAGILSAFIPGGTSLESYLFGSVTSVTRFDVILSIALFLIVVILYNGIYYGAIINLVIDEKHAKLVGVPTRLLGMLYTLLVAITIALAAKMIGALIVSSLIILPVATALFLANNYKKMMIYSSFFGFFYMMSGLVLSYYVEVSPGGAVVLIALVMMLILYLLKKGYSLK